MTGNKAFGQRIRDLREQRKLTDPAFSLRRFAEAADLSPTFISKMETGEFDPPAPATIKRMAELLQIDADELLALAGRVDPKLNDIIKEQPKAMADFLRTAQGLSAKRLQEITEQLKHEQSRKGGKK